MRNHWIHFWLLSVLSVAEHKSGTLQKCTKAHFLHLNITEVFGLHIKIELNCQTLHVSATMLFFLCIFNRNCTNKNSIRLMGGCGSASRKKDDWCKKQKHHRISNSNCTDRRRKRNISNYFLFHFSTAFDERMKENQMSMTELANRKHWMHENKTTITHLITMMFDAAWTKKRNAWNRFEHIDSIFRSFVHLFLEMIFLVHLDLIFTAIWSRKMKNGDQKLSHKQILTSILIIISFRAAHAFFQMDWTDWLNWQPSTQSELSFYFFTWYIYAKSSIHASWTFSSLHPLHNNIRNINCAVRRMNFVRYLSAAFSTPAKFLPKQEENFALDE